MKTKQKTYWWIDTLLFIGFQVAFFLSLTGVELHQWIGIFGGLLAIYHLLAHWDWVRGVSRKLLTSASGTLQLRFFVDGILLAGFATIIGTGLVISSWLDISLSNSNVWLCIHILVSITTLLILIIKLGMHWRWISKTARDTFSQPVLQLTEPVKLQPFPIERTSMERRDFLKVMGVVAGGSLIALMSATKSLASLQDGENTAVSEVDTSNPEQWSFNSSGDPNQRIFNNSGVVQSFGMDSGFSGSCSIQCGKSCSYPGHCRRYTDSNNNNLCDYGECA